MRGAEQEALSRRLLLLLNSKYLASGDWLSGLLTGDGDVVNINVSSFPWIFNEEKICIRGKRSHFLSLSCLQIWLVLLLGSSCSWIC